MANPQPRAAAKFKTYVTATWLTPMGEISVTHGFDRNGQIGGFAARIFCQLCLSSDSCVGVSLTVDGKSEGSRDGPAS